MPSLKKSFLICLCLFLLALTVNLCVGFKLGMQRKMESDALYYKQIAQSLAVGQGYSQREGFWPDKPTMSRLPGWPFIVALTFRAFPGACPDVVMRVLNLLLNTVVALLVAGLTMILFRNVPASFIAGGLYSIHPTALYLAYTGESEVLFLALCIGGTMIVLAGRSARWLGFILLGASCLVRANFVLWIMFYAVLCMVLMVKKRQPDMSGPYSNVCPAGIDKFPLLTFVFCVLLFVLPPALWMLRNYRVCGRFPVMSSLRGEVFYGGNNALTCGSREYWGYWVFPDRIPGEQSKKDLAATMSECAMDVYYYEKGKVFVRQNLMRMPRLLFGKLVRAYIPVPWKLNVATAGASLYRWGLYITCIVGMLFVWGKTECRYKAILFTMVLVNISTVLFFWGCARFAFEVEPFLVPFSAVGVLKLMCPGILQTDK